MASLFYHHLVGPGRIPGNYGSFLSLLIHLHCGFRLCKGHVCLFFGPVQQMDRFSQLTSAIFHIPVNRLPLLAQIMERPYIFLKGEHGI